MMDHGWDGFYTSQKRLTRFPAIVEAPKGSVYELTMTGTPPKNMRFTIRAKSDSASMTIRLAYPSAESRSITKDDGSG